MAYPPQSTVDDALTTPAPPSKTTLLRLFANARATRRPLHVLAPMVRYSKLPLRLLVQHYAVDVTYTPMILAREFRNSPHARTADFSTCSLEGPVIAQFGAATSDDLCAATRLIRPFVTGIGLNCGCPIKDQNELGIGAALMRKVDTVEAMVRALRAEFGDDLLVDVKIRIHADLDITADFAARIAAAGADIITVHGRRKKHRNAVPASMAAVRRVRDAVPRGVYVVANGDCMVYSDIARMAAESGADGVMAARGILANPALFSGAPCTPWAAIERFMAYADFYGGKFQHLQLALVDMTVGLLTKQERHELRMLRSWVELREYMDKRFVLLRPGEEGFGEKMYDNFRR
ncbi:uncharacterized protein V1518DRAFT_423637 [Limtongia smithiae]|uniref:uncharacterized protein n=1 Tax=Limtongia smithiae TaxID=1125753 RepID=UPI0034CD9D77